MLSGTEIELLNTIIPCVIAALATVLGSGGILKYILERREQERQEEIKKANDKRHADIEDALGNAILPVNNALKDMKEEINLINNSFKEHCLKEDYERMDTMRVRLIRFSDELINNQTNPNKEYFNLMMLEADKYEDWCENHPEYENSLIVESIEIIREEHKKFKRGER